MYNVRSIYFKFIKINFLIKNILKKNFSKKTDLTNYHEQYIKFLFIRKILFKKIIIINDLENKTAKCTILNKINFQ